MAIKVLIIHYPDVHESWVQEEVMKEFACKELARFFLSRIRWTKS
jgi:hypothetical protein